MSGVFVPSHQHRFAPHLLQTRRSPSRSGQSSPNMTSRKRKADDDVTPEYDDRMMSTSPSASPSLASRSLPSASSPATATTNIHKSIKRARTNLGGRALSLPRLLETLGEDDLRTVLRSVCERHQEIHAEVLAVAPRPSVSSALDVLAAYQHRLQASFPFGGRSSSDYAFNRVRQHLTDLIDALKDYIPPFLPPHEDQASTSLKFLDGATDLVHALPNWDSFQHNRPKQDAYEELARAWTLVIREAAKRGGGIQLQYGRWDQKLMKHNEMAAGKLEEAVNELRSCIGWMGNDGSGGSGGPGMGGFQGGAGGSGGGGSGGPGGNNDQMSIRQQLLSGTYGFGPGAGPVKVGPW